MVSHDEVESEKPAQYRHASPASFSDNLFMSSTHDSTVTRLGSPCLMSPDVTMRYTVGS